MKEGKPDPIPVRFLGLLDPTAPVKGLTEDKEFMDPDLRTVPSTVQFAGILTRDGKHDGLKVVAAPFFIVGKITFDSKTKVLLNEQIPLSHSDMGFRKQVAEKLWKAMEAAGIARLPEYKKSAFAEPGYNDKKRGGLTWEEDAIKIFDETRKRLAEDLGMKKPP
jgi:hypothetical protein